MSYLTVAFDGPSLVGKSTLVQMLMERSLDAEVVRENTRDPHRTATSRLNALLKERPLEVAVKSVKGEFPNSCLVLDGALEYAAQFDEPLRRQASLAYLFTAGRSVVDKYVRAARERHEVILDRWRMSGCAYQADPQGYTWQEINRLNESFGILMPDMQFFLTCPIAQIPLRRAYRQKVGLGTAGQMSTGREHLIVKAFQEMYDCLQGSGMSIYLFENAGIPVPELDEQIQQAIPAFQKVEQLVAEGGFRLAPGQSGQSGQPGQNSESFWLSPERLARIYERQTK